jgi:hypothetical protein
VISVLQEFLRIEFIMVRLDVRHLPAGDSKWAVIHGRELTEVRMTALLNVLLGWFKEVNLVGSE